MKLVPLEDHILIEPVSEEKKSAWWFILPENDKEKPSQGTVVAVWQWKILDNGQRAPIDVKPWDTVYFTKYSPDELKIGEWDDEKTYLVVRHTNILAVEQ